MAQTLEVEAILQQYTKLVDPVIKKLLAKGVSKQTRELLHYQINTGGKRLRPALAIGSCLACGGKIQDVIYPAAGLEILHTYTLITDDIIDNSSLRRGRPTTWKKFGRSFAECAAADYGASLLDVIAKTKNPRQVSRIYAEALKTIMDGQIKDVLLEQKGRADEPYAKENRITHISFPAYKQMIGNKTASLFGASCELGALTALASAKQVATLKEYGWNLGIAFQIIDDILDIYGTKTGKPHGQDIREHKLGNILVFFALKELTHKNKLTLAKVLCTSSPSYVDIKKAVTLIKTTAAKEKAVKLAFDYSNIAKKALVALQPSQHRAFLENIVNYICCQI